MNSIPAKPVFLLLALLMTISGYGQNDRAVYDSVTRVIQIKYNASRANEIYSMTAEAFRERMTAEQFAQGMSNFFTKAGQWNSFEFKEVNDKGVDYTSRFQKGIQIFSLKLDEQGKITRMNFAAVTSTDKTYQVASDNPLKDSTDLRIEQLVRPYIQKGHTAGLALAIIDGKKVRKYHYGTIDKTKQQLPDAASTLFEIGSVTKTFTSLLLAQQVLAGRMQLDDPISKYLPDSIPALNFQGHAIMLKHLSNHTSGFPRLPDNIFIGKVDMQDPYKYYTEDLAFRFLKSYRPAIEPGTVFAYSNFGSGLLGILLERKTGRSFEQLVLTDICKPLGMRSTVITLNTEQQQRLAKGYNEKGVATSPWDLASLKGAGALRSTLNDMIIYTQAQMGRQNSLKRAIQLTHQPTFEGNGQSMGLGWLITPVYLHHSGGTGGFRSFVAFDESRQLGIVILSNTAEDVSAIGDAFLRR